MRHLVHLFIYFLFAPQGERGRDGVDGRKGEPVSRSLTVSLQHKINQKNELLTDNVSTLCVCDVGS